MNDWTLPAQGGCRCGALRFRITTAPMITSLCHCRGCQQMTGSAFATTLMVASSGFEVTGGEPVLGGLKGPVARHHHCDSCKSWVFTRVGPDDRFVNVRATQMDEAHRFKPFVEVFTREQLPWVQTGAERSYPQFPLETHYGELLPAYAEWVGARASAAKGHSLPDVAAEDDGSDFDFEPVRMGDISRPAEFE